LPIWMNYILLAAIIIAAITSVAAMEAMPTGSSGRQWGKIASIHSCPLSFLPAHWMTPAM
jgi:hypothetical protein